MLAWMLSAAATLGFATAGLWCCYHRQRKHEAARILRAISECDLPEFSRLVRRPTALQSVSDWFGDPVLILLVRSLPTTGSREFVLEAISLLLSGGANIDERGIDCKSALMHAAELGSPEICGRLLCCGADPAAGDSFGRTAVFYAAHAGHEPVVSLLRRIPQR